MHKIYEEVCQSILLNNGFIYEESNLTIRNYIPFYIESYIHYIKFQSNLVRNLNFYQKGNFDQSDVAQMRADTSGYFIGFLEDFCYNNSFLFHLIYPLGHDFYLVENKTELMDLVDRLELSMIKENYIFNSNLIYQTFVFEGFFKDFGFNADLPLDKDIQNVSGLTLLQNYIRITFQFLSEGKVGLYPFRYGLFKMIILNLNLIEEETKFILEKIDLIRSFEKNVVISIEERELEKIFDFQNFLIDQKNEIDSLIENQNRVIVEEVRPAVQVNFGIQNKYHLLPNDPNYYYERKLSHDHFKVYMLSGGDTNRYLFFLGYHWTGYYPLKIIEIASKFVVNHFFNPRVGWGGA